jgi:DNA-binding NarL/FixJ family response regulator
VIDPQRARAEAIGRAMQAHPDVELVASVCTCEEAVDRLADVRADVALVADGGPEEVRELRRVAPRTGVVVMVGAGSLGRPADALAAIDAGAGGLVATDDTFDELVAAVRGVSDHHLVLSPTTMRTLLRPGPVGATGLDEPAADGPDDEAVAKARARYGLTPREVDVLVALGDGHDPQTIARLLGMSVHTARGHLKNLMFKIGAHSQVELLVLALRRGLLPAMVELEAG